VSPGHIAGAAASPQQNEADGATYRAHGAVSLAELLPRAPISATRSVATASQRSGRDALDVRLRLLKPLVERGTDRPFELDSLTCQVQLKVPDLKVDDIGQSDGTLVVPSTVDGPKVVGVAIVTDGKRQTNVSRSSKV
jgi:hypothetical protein